MNAIAVQRDLRDATAVIREGIRGYRQATYEGIKKDNQLESEPQYKE